MKKPPFGGSLEAPIGIEPMNTGFAVPGLTTWLRRLAVKSLLSNNAGRLRGPAEWSG